MSTSSSDELIAFLQNDLSVPAEAIELGLRQVGAPSNLLPIVLWQYGIVSTQQLDLIFDWLETSLE